MSEFKPVVELVDMTTLDDAEVVSGYRHGLAGGEEPYNCTRSYWHGWRNGAVDGGWREKDIEQAKLAAEVYRRMVAN